jgi:chromosome segregation protein
VLDELDAPLDESNIGRFLNMLDQFIDKSQFVIVTHNKKTMRRADVMYGITMEEFGVSKPVGVKLSKEDESQEKARRAAREAAAAAARSATESSATPIEESSAPEPPADATEPAMAS